MKRFILATLLAFGLAVPSFADVTVKAMAGGKGMGMSATMQTVTYIKGNKMRTLGKTATGYDSEIIVPATIGGKGGMKMTVTMTGPIWIVKGAPGAAEKGWIFSDPRGAKGQPGQAKAMAGMMAKMGNMSSTSTAQSVETGTLAADLFAPPAGYQIKEQK